MLERIETSVFKIIIGNGFWKTCIPDKNAMRIKWGLEKDMFYVAYIGKTANELNWAIDAINCIDVALQPKTTLIIAGPPKALIEKLLKKTSDNIIYLGELTVEQARELASASDLGLIPLENSLFNQSRFPIKFFDFLTVGTPIYLSNVGEIALLSKSLDYVFCGSNNKKEWIKQFSEVVEKGSIALKSNEKDIAFIESYQWTHLAKKQLSFYQTAIEDKS